MTGRVLYSEERDGTRFIGTIDQIAALVGTEEKYLHNIIKRSRTTENGWKIQRRLVSVESEKGK